MKEMEDFANECVKPMLAEASNYMKRMKYASLENEAAEKLKDLDTSYCEELTELMKKKTEKEGMLKNREEELKGMDSFWQEKLPGNPLEEIEKKVSQATALLEEKKEEARAKHATIVRELSKSNDEADKFMWGTGVKTPDTAKKNLATDYATCNMGGGSIEWRPT